MNLTYEIIKHKIDSFSEENQKSISCYEWIREKNSMKNFLENLKGEDQKEIRSYFYKLMLLDEKMKKHFHN